MLKIGDFEKLENGKYVCPHCNKEYTKNGICTHIWRSHTEEGAEFSAELININNNKIVWNKGLTKETDERVNKQSETLKNKYKSGELIFHMTGKNHTEETIKKLKENCGGCRVGSGRSKSGWYKDIWCDSTYELCWLIYQLDNGNSPTRCKFYYEYFYEGEIHKYYPDFLLNGIIYEIKGYETKRDLEKYKSVIDKKLIVIRTKDLEHIFNYIKEKYKTIKYHELYDFNKKTYKDLKHDLCECGKEKFKYSDRCRSCNSKLRIGMKRKVERPSYEQLLQEINESSYSAVSRKYGVSNNAIKKWIESFEKAKK